MRRAGGFSERRPRPPIAVKHDGKTNGAVSPIPRGGDDRVGLPGGDEDASASRLLVLIRRISKSIRSVRARRFDLAVHLYPLTE